MLISFLITYKGEGNSVGGSPLKPKKEQCDHKGLGFEWSKMFIKYFRVIKSQYSLHLLFRILLAIEGFIFLSWAVL